MLTKFRYLHRAYRYRFRVDRAELRFVCDCLQPGQVAVDAGCHKGAYTYWMRRQVGSTGAVYAFEPQPRQAAYLREVFSVMEYDNVVLVPAALSEVPGQMSLYVPTGAGKTHLASLERKNEPGFSNSALPTCCSRLTVNVTTLDAVFIDQPRGPNFMKVDVEGHELAVLHGARQTLTKYRPTLLIECEARHRPDGDVRPVFEFLTSLGYRGSFFCRGHRQPLAAFEPPFHQPSLSDAGQVSRRYVNNFVFEYEVD